jgi:hypothetical protein
MHLSLTFDRLYIGVLIFTAIIFRSNINVVSVLTIIFLQHTLEEFAWIILSENYLVKIALYIVGFWSAYYFRHDWISKVLLTCTVFAVG